MGKLLTWGKTYGLFALTLFLLAFIPLYPKLPLINVIRSWVYIRLEDFLILLATVVLGITFIRKRRISSSPLTVPIICYWIIGGISLLQAVVFIFPHITGLYAHIGLLHYFRRIEYMMLFFLAYEAYKKTPKLLPVLYTLIGSYILIILYGFGQKFLGFPAFLTMNEEFAKGLPLRLPPTARFPSTFGGHYDLAAYLVMVIPIMGSFFIGSKKVWQKIAFIFLTFFGLIMLLFTASRISFGVYLIVMTVMLCWHKKYMLIIPMIVVSLLVMNFTSGASERFYKTFRVSDVVIDLSTGKAIGTLDNVDGQLATLQKGESPAEESLPKGSEYVNLSGGNDNQIKSISYLSKTVSGATGEIATVSGSFLIQRALVYDISITTRFQAEWPNAMKAFSRNIFLGSGYSSLSVATDGDYHRMLGETGLFGFIAFLGIFAVLFFIFMKRKDTLADNERNFVIGVFAGIVGLMVNAVLIDVFEASKVAYTMWSFLGIATAIMVIKKPITVKYFSYLKTIATHRFAYIFYLVFSLWVIWGKTFSLYFMGDDFTWLRWAAQSTYSDLLKYFTESQGFFYRPIPKLWYFFMFSIFWLKPFAYHVMSIVLLSASVLCIYHILLRLRVFKPFAWFGSLFFGVLSVHHENIYWISGQSSLLASVFLLVAIAGLIESTYRKRLKAILVTVSIISVLLSMLSYDGMLVAPLLVFLVGISILGMKPYMVSYLLLMPLYWAMRTFSGALLPEGDYGYKQSTFIVNTVANIIGYKVSIFGGPKVIESANSIREVFRPFLKQIVIGLTVMFGGILVCIKKIIPIAAPYKRCIVWFICFGVSLAAYAPLGGMAERYVFIPSIFAVIGLVVLSYDVWVRSRHLWVRGVIFLLFTICITFNISEVLRVGGDWEKASSVVEQSLRVIKKEAFPPKNPKNFYIVNMPIRYGRAWIYSVGMTDALWHIYRQSPYTVTLVNSIEDGYSRYFKNGDREVFIFEDYVIKRGIEKTEMKEN